MREVPHFYSCHRSVAEFNGERIYLTDYETTDAHLDTAIAEMRSEARKPDNADFAAWKERAITLHESMSLYDRLAIENGKPR